jgi:hypothetical protein
MKCKKAIDISSSPSGIYIIKVSGSDCEVERKVMIDYGLTFSYFNRLKDKLHQYLKKIKANLGEFHVISHFEKTSCNTQNISITMEV